MSRDTLSTNFASPSQASNRKTDDHALTFSLKSKHPSPSPPLMSTENGCGSRSVDSTTPPQGNIAKLKAKPKHSKSAKNTLSAITTTSKNKSPRDRTPTGPVSPSKKRRNSKTLQTGAARHMSASPKPKPRSPSSTKENRSLNLKSKTPSQRNRRGSRSRGSRGSLHVHDALDVITPMEDSDDDDDDMPHSHSRPSLICNASGSVHKRARTPVTSSYDDDALLKRLKAENKELRKSRNSLRKDHDILRKIEGKLRHKLEILMAKFKHIALDLGDVHDNAYWAQLQKNGDIEGVLEAVFNKFGQITDEYMKQQKTCKEHDRKWAELKKKWHSFETKHLQMEGAHTAMTVLSSMSSASGSAADSKSFDVDHMFMCLRQRMKGVQQEKKQAARATELENELLIARTKSEKLQHQKADLYHYKQQYLCISKQLTEKESEFEDTRLTITNRLTDTETELVRFKQEHLHLSNNLQSKATQLQEVQSKYEHTSQDLQQLQSENTRLQQRNDELQSFEQQYHDTQQELQQRTDEVQALKAQNLMLSKRSDTLRVLQTEYTQMQTHLNDNKHDLDALQRDFNAVHQQQQSLTSENKTLRGQNSTLNASFQSLQDKHSKLSAKLNPPTSESGTQTDFAFILEDAHLKALQRENAYLMKEINFLIAERSRFTECTGNTDVHLGDVNSMAVSPTDYTIVTGGKSDNSVRIWQPQISGASEITFVPKQKALVDGTVLSVNISADGVLMAAGCSLKKSVNGYVVVWNLKNHGTVLCNLRSRTLVRFGKVHCVQFMKFEPQDCVPDTVTSSFSSLSMSASSSAKRAHKKTGSQTPGAKMSTSSGGVKHKKKTRSRSIQGQAKDISGALFSGFGGGSKSRGTGTGTSGGGGSNSNVNGSTGFNYLLFGGDTTGCILCWNLSVENCATPVCVINGHTDIVYDLCIVQKRWLFSVSHDQTLMACNIGDFPSKEVDGSSTSSMDYVFGRRLFKDDSKYPLKSITYNRATHELMFGSRKCNIFQLCHHLSDGGDNDEKEQYFAHKKALSTKDLDHIAHLRLRDNLMAVQRIGVSYVRVFNMEQNKSVKSYQIDDDDDNKYRIYDCGITFDKKYTVLCVGIFGKDNTGIQHCNGSAIKGFKIPKPSAVKK